MGSNLRFGRTQSTSTAELSLGEVDFLSESTESPVGLLLLYWSY